MHWEEGEGIHPPSLVMMLAPAHMKLRTRFARRAKKLFTFRRGTSRDTATQLLTLFCTYRLIISLRHAAADRRHSFL